MAVFSAGSSMNSPRRALPIELTATPLAFNPVEDGDQAGSSLASTSVSSIEQVQQGQQEQQGQEVNLSLNLTLADAAAGADAAADAADASADRAELWVQLLDAAVVTGPLGILGSA